MPETDVFRNALVYTVVSQACTTIIDNSTENGIIVMIVFFSILVYISMAIHRQVVSGAVNTALSLAEDGAVARFVQFVSSTSLNLILQFQSNFVGRFALSTLDTRQSPMYTIGVASCAIILLWLLNESFVLLRPLPLPPTKRD
jgi:hypothetical protein